MRFSLIFSLLVADGFRATAEMLSFRDEDIAAVNPRGLDLNDIKLSRTEQGWLVLEVSCTAMPDPARIRLLFDVDGPAKGEPESGADYMLEGATFYRYPESGDGWSWDAYADVVRFFDDKKIIYLLTDLPAVEKFGWRAESITEELSVADRLPNEGLLDFAPPSLPLHVQAPSVAPEDLKDLLSFRPRTLAFRLDAEIKSYLWTPSDPSNHIQMAWQPAFMESPVSWRVDIYDPVTDQSAELQPETVSLCSNITQFAGRALDVNWVLLSEATPDGGQKITGQLQSENERCLQVRIHSGVRPDGWIWHDDIHSSRSMDATGVYEQSFETPYGKSGKQSVYPFGVISSPQGMAVVETSPDEPRVFRISAEPGEGFFGITYELGLTPETSNFPGRASFACAFHSARTNDHPPFRWWLDQFYAGNPSYYERRFSLTDLDSNGLMGSFQNSGFIFSDPWFYSMPCPGRLPVNPVVALQLLSIYGSLSRTRDAEIAVAVQLGSCRGPDGRYEMTLPQSESLPAVLFESSSDPELSIRPEMPINRAMSEWRILQNLMQAGVGNSVFLETVDRLASIDYNPQALAVADYPCSYKEGINKPGLVSSISANEFIEPLAGYLRQQGGCLAGYFPSNGLPFLVRNLDAVIARCPSMTHSEWALLRSLTGSKPVGIHCDVVASELTSDSFKRYVDECLFYGFLPGYTLRDGSEPDVRKDYSARQSLILRLAEAGWKPLGPVLSSEGTVRVEHFGDAASNEIMHVTVKNVSDDPQSAGLILSPASSMLWVNPLTANLFFNQHTNRISLSAGEVQTWDLVPAGRIEEESVFARSWSSAEGESEAIQKSLESVKQEILRDAWCEVAFPQPAVDDEDNTIRIHIANKGKKEFTVSEVKVISSNFRPFDIQPLVVNPNAWAEITAFFRKEDLEEKPWIEVSWTLQQGTNHLTASRMIRPVMVPPIEIHALSTSVTVFAEGALLDLKVRNYSATSRVVRLEWEGDFRGGEKEQIVEAGRDASIQIPVGRIKVGREGQMLVRGYAGDRRLFSKWFEIRQELTAK